MSRTPIRYLPAMLVVGAAVAAAILLCFASCSRDTVAPVPATSSSPADVPPRYPGPQAKTELGLPAGRQVSFADVTAKAGIRFEHFDGHTEMEYIMETLGA